MAVKYVMCRKFTCDKKCIHKGLHVQQNACSEKCQQYSMMCEYVDEDVAKKWIRLEKKIALATARGKMERVAVLEAKRNILRQYLTLDV